MFFEVDEEGLLTSLAKVDKARASEAYLAKVHGHVEFFCKYCCGDSTYEAAGIYHDAAQGHYISKAAVAWIRSNNLQVTFKCTFTEHGEVPSRVIARAWADRMQHVFTI